MTDIRELMSAVDANPKSSYTKGEVKTILNSISGFDQGSIEVEKIRRGDVFAGTLVGGKRRPWLTIAVRADTVVAVALTSGASVPGARPARCRYWPDSFVGSAISLFDHEYARKAFIRPYSNLADLRDIEAQLADLYQLRPHSKPSKRPPESKPRVIYTKGAAS